MAARIVGVGKYVPEKVMTNLELETMVETSDDWIVERTGIRERRIAAAHETASSMGAEAARMALHTAGVGPESVDLIICATMTPDGMFPASAAAIQEALGARNAAAFDVNAACAGFIAALATGSQFVNTGVYERVLVVGAEVLSRIVDWSDRGTCVLFGDGAGAVLLERSDRGGPSAFVLKNDGSGGHLLYAKGLTSAPASLAETEGFCIVMDGREVFRFAVRAMEEASRQSLQMAGLGVDDIAFVVPHQANQRIISAVAKNLGVPSERVISNVERYGNTSAASVPLALCEAWEEGRLKDGDKLVIVAFGGGLAWGSAIVEWTGLGSCLATSAK
ncbi:MAG TPA: beta-ketoacyl-ACP synthase III [Dehalococcoidia bacterium]|nr:beta-ketoacyl-ACP synthase III [Dehalococcoidia bacterium]